MIKRAIVLAAAAAVVAGQASAALAIRDGGAGRWLDARSVQSQRGAAVRRLAFANTEPFAPDQWYLDQDHAWDHWLEQPRLATVKVAVIDSGIDYSHPEFLGRVAAGDAWIRQEVRSALRAGRRRVPGDPRAPDARRSDCGG